MSPLTLEQAAKITDAALEEGARRRFAPLCVVVLDPGGHALVLKRMEKASISRPQIATAKAAGCLGLGLGGRELARRARAAPAFLAALNSIFPQGIIPVAGGVLIRNAAGELLGAMGVSGDTSDNDEICAVAGIQAAGLVADTGGTH
ncbi:MAG TPA: heme-binding protein [Steroidobacteraceae bacterium]|nr:heme-binding protein [Steroidobacteraceae bacterium]